MRTHEGQSKTLNSEEFQQLIDHVKATSQFPERDIAILNISYRSGLRAMEISNLHISDVLDENADLRRTVVLRKKATKGTRGGVAFFTHVELREALSAYLKVLSGKTNDSNGADAPTSTKAKCESDHEWPPANTSEYPHLFLSKKKTPFHPSSMSRLFTNLCKGAGFSGVTSHFGRRSLAKNLNAQDVSVYNIQKILRHKNIQTTVNHYLSVDEDHLADLISNV